MTHGYDVAAADEDVRLAEGDAAVDKLRRARNDEDPVAIELELRVVVRLAGVLDGEVVQAELRLNAAQQLVGGLVQPDPDDVPGLGGPLVRFLDPDIPDTAAAAVDGCGHEARFTRRKLCRGRTALALRLDVGEGLGERFGFEDHRRACAKNVGPKTGGRRCLYEALNVCFTTGPRGGSTQSTARLCRYRMLLAYRSGRRSRKKPQSAR